PQTRITLGSPALLQAIVAGARRVGNRRFRRLVGNDGEYDQQEHNGDCQNAKCHQLLPALLALALALAFGSATTAHGSPASLDVVVTWGTSVQQPVANANAARLFSK